MTVPPLWSGGGGGGGGAGEVESSGGPDESRYRRQARLLALRCRQIAQHNTRLVNRIYQVKKLSKRYKKEIKFLMARLDTHGDAFRTVVAEEDVKPNISNLQYSMGLNVVKTDKHLSNKSAVGDKSIPPKKTQKKKSSRSDKSDKDRAASKKQFNPLLQFSQEQRPLVIAESSSDLAFSDASKQDKTRLLTAKWKALSNEDKKMKSKNS
ncbi:uncharacterized protein LOC143914861 [Arctopsyche grandis]|uniref:uncharacterized protein LOC143914861 n=1 Tax=Arctopsyche grandis TaxID=121162 RepID=UPI00406D8F32